MRDLNQCKIDGCHEEAAATRGRWANLCDGHKAEAVAQARAEGSLGSPAGPAARKPTPEPEPEPEPQPEPELPAAELEPLAPPPSAPRDPEKVDTFELFDTLATEERIAYYEETSRQALVKAEALRRIRDALETVRELEPA